LPDWCKVAEVVYDNLLREYCCVEEYEERDWYINNIESGRIKQARKRPFNAEEMKALVGKVIENEAGNLMLVTMASPNSGGQIKFCNMWYTANELLKKGYTIDGKPCYVLEHLENGEWVE
jgi:hypothetical protein